jgi:hypothetical protein
VIDIEWLDSGTRTGILRAGDELDKYLDPYEFSCIIQIKDNMAYLKGGCGAFKPGWKTHVYRELLKHGVEYVYWDRVRKDGSIHTAGPYKVEE